MYCFEANAVLSFQSCQRETVGKRDLLYLCGSGAGGGGGANSSEAPDTRGSPPPQME